MRVYQAFGQFIDLEAVAVIQGRAPTVDQVWKQLEAGGLMSRFFQVGSLVVQLVNKPVEVNTRLNVPSAATREDAAGEAERIGQEWEGLIEAWKAVKSG